MNTDEIPPETSPVFEELAIILQGIDECPNPSDWDLRRCPALTKRKTRCKNKLNDQDAEKAQQLRHGLRLIVDRPKAEDDGELLSQLKEFLAVTHCRHHDRDALQRLESWNTTRGGAPESLSFEEPPTVSDDSYQGADTPKSTALTAAAQPVDSQTDPSTEVADVEVSMLVETVTESVSTLTVTAAGETVTAAATTEIHETTNVVVAERIEGLGVTRPPRRRVSQRDHSAVFAEISKPLRNIERNHGVVYVLAHNKLEDTFKIGFTRGTAAARLRQPNNCAGRNAHIIHETPGGPFLGAAKAERLAQVVLEFHNIGIAKCDECGGGHKEWFRSSKETVLDTVAAMENFVRLPAYEQTGGDDGEWKLSEAAGEIVSAMCHFSVKRLRSTMMTTGAVAEPTGGEDEGFDDVDVDVDIVDDDGDDEATEILTSGQDESGSRDSVVSAGPGESLGEQDKSEPAVAAKEKRRRRRIYLPWVRQGTSEELGDPGAREHSKRSNGESGRSSEKVGNVNDAFMGILLSLWPEDAKNREANGGKGSPDRKDSWLRKRTKGLGGWARQRRTSGA
ncbi:hypothetical protein CORC01_06902 [Colletotrichum orchidophilum]|uniref:Bacteriophage T5 Orf172 DNA-binding domain-containing protein n=1 Tax=Colletotrichum orchidophilum TaxID=1209926 RepID=A0A1G4B8F3_9PEZI|nr:uncharacterized protein CORC01_06902 [Colletotrichum orchidophilum]OHE97697.1 hypothetical protein CORC01_06902 [Colletotrichum orchidophilum]